MSDNIVKVYAHYSCLLWNNDIKTEKIDDKIVPSNSNASTIKSDILSSQQKDENIISNDKNTIKTSVPNQNKPKLNIKQKEKKEEIYKFNIEKFRSKCDICGKYNYGPVVKCARKNCGFKMHPGCAVLKLYYMQMELIPWKNSYKHNIYCLEHLPNPFESTIEKNNKEFIERINDFNRILNRLYTINKKKKEKNLKSDFVYYKP